MMLAGKDKVALTQILRKVALESLGKLLFSYILLLY
jgi:hypothetical protein